MSSLVFIIAPDKPLDIITTVSFVLVSPSISIWLKEFFTEFLRILVKLVEDIPASVVM